MTWKGCFGTGWDWISGEEGKGEGEEVGAREEALGEGGIKLEWDVTEFEF